MRLDRLPLSRTLLVPVLVLLLGLAVVASITGLQALSRDSANAQQQLGRSETALNALQLAPFRAAAATGGSPQVARGLIDANKRKIDRVVARLLRDSPPQALRRVPALLRANYATLERIYDFGVADGDYGKEADALAGRSGRQAGRVVEQIGRADREYGARAATAATRATIGSAVMILLLVGSFGYLYRRSIRGRATAERLVVENGRLLTLSRAEALTDSLTGLPNRRSLRRDLDAAVGGEQVHALALMDLDGFKQYNDTFGHPAGDALLARLGERLAAAVRGRGTAYRMGGDEFCVLAAVGTEDITVLMDGAADALSEAGEAFDIGCSIGWVRTGHEVATAEEALRIADQRMYAHKVGRASSTRQSTDVLLKVLSERSPYLGAHVNDVADLAEALSRARGLDELDVHWIRLAAELHDVGKVAIPDAILNKPGPLSDEEWAFMRRHTLIGERIIGSAASLEPAAALVRSSHERYDGKGYPDGLRAGEIDVGASIISICDAYDAMVTDRVYCARRSPDEALAELRRCAGTQFHPALVELFCTVVGERVAADALAAV